VALVTNEKEAPQLSQPVGSRQEVEDLGCPTRNISTCSLHTPDNMGCEQFRVCDREWRGTRPRNEIVQRISAAGGVRVTHMPCFAIIPKELAANDNGELYEVIGGEGETYSGRGSVKRHPHRDPDCNDCSLGKCEAWDDREDLEFHCPEFPAAATHKELVKFARKIVARKGGAVRQKAAIKARLLGGDEPEEVSEVAEVKSGKSRFGRGSRTE
jgi:hypothetical protein